MNKQIGLPMLLCGIVGIIGLLVIAANFWIGASMVLGASGVLLFTTRRQSAAPAKIRPTTTVAFEPQVDRFLNNDKVQVPNVDRGKVRLLAHTLIRSALDPDADVFYYGESQVITARDILIEMIDIAEAHGKTIEQLAQDIVKMYPCIWENVELALKHYPNDAYLAKVFLARKAMVDVQWQFDKEP